MNKLTPQNERKAGFKTALLFSTLFFLLAISIIGIANAREIETEARNRAGAVPGSAMYGFDKAFDRLSLALTSGDERKAEKEIEIAKERYAELEVLALDGKMNELQEAENEHNAMISRARGHVNKLEKGENEREIRDNVLRVINLQKKIEEHENEVDETHEELKEIIPEPNNKIVYQSVDRVNSNVLFAMQSAEDKKINAAGDLRRATGKDESEIEAEVRRMEDNSGLTSVRRNRAGREINKQEIELEKIDNILDDNGDDFDVSGLRDDIEKSRRLLGRARESLSEGDRDEAKIIIASVKEFNDNFELIKEDINTFGKEFKTVAKVDGDGALSSNAEETLRVLRKSFDDFDVHKDVKIVVKNDGGRIRVDGRIEGSLNSQERALVEKLKAEAASSVGTIDDKEIKIRVKRELEIENEIEIEVEREFEHQFENEFEIGDDLIRREDRALEIGIRGREAENEIRGREAENEIRGREAENEIRGREAEIGDDNGISGSSSSGDDIRRNRGGSSSSDDSSSGDRRGNSESSGGSSSGRSSDRGRSSDD